MRRGSNVKARKTSELLRALERKGFRLEDRDHVYCYLYVDGKRSPIRTKVSHGHKDYGPRLQSEMAWQLHLSNRDFEALINCPLSYEHYVEMLRRAGAL